uniref:Uncharacterized protein n=1 Tax=Pipistrellus kuhlii TaxID=59472 RepID=A0A7J7YNT2_PIPKU|nr:hypothetical protein mPipKuh1_010157 [Pipistrellus kuhlii]
MGGGHCCQFHHFPEGTKAACLMAKVQLIPGSAWTPRGVSAAAARPDFHHPHRFLSVTHSYREGSKNAMHSSTPPRLRRPGWRLSGKLTCRESSPGPRSPRRLTAQALRDTRSSSRLLSLRTFCVPGAVPGPPPQSTQQDGYSHCARGKTEVQVIQPAQVTNQETQQDLGPSLPLKLMYLLSLSCLLRIQRPNTFVSLSGVIMRGRLAPSRTRGRRGPLLWDPQPWGSRRLDDRSHHLPEVTQHT